MKRNFIVAKKQNIFVCILKCIIVVAFVSSVIVSDAPCDAAVDDSRWVHPLYKTLAVDSIGPFLELADGRLMTVDAKGMRTSKDDGKTWTEARPVCEGLAGLRNGNEPATFYIQQTKSGALVIVFLNATTYNFSWDNKINQPKDDCRLEVWAVRSLDGGKTWIDRQRILEGYNPNWFGFIQIRSGRLVAVVPHIVLDPGRYAACSLTSDDEGKTWRRSNLIDLGGHGHHSGAMEPAVAELGDGRLLMMIRTHWGRFWEAYSDDGGLSWRTIVPSPIESTSAPGHLLKLRSGRLVFVCNGKANREELLLRFSEDDAKTWTKPIVIARQKGGQLSYPYMFERRPGEIWVIAGFAFKKGWKDSVPLHLKINEDDFIKEAKKME
ncbi:MAG: exo-alpha-sialidase [Pirellulales bacterium]|nr:exo-alpha-sialidase [Pirellulales bacterium]